MQKNIINVVLAMLFLVLGSSQRKIDSIEGSSCTNPLCNQLCSETALDSYGNTILQNIPSKSNERKELYPGSDKYVCIPCVCGNGEIDEGEECDFGDKNTLNKCGADCTDLTYLCGNGKIDKTLGEECDDGNSEDNDECTNDCRIGRCGDGILNNSEDCDGTFFSKNIINNSSIPEEIFAKKSCSTECKVEYLPFCGDGIRNGSEICEEEDFGDLKKPVNISQAAFDSKICDPVLCKPIYDSTCGNGIVELGEDCDDGNKINGDKCTSKCKIQANLCHYKVDFIGMLTRKGSHKILDERHLNAKKVFSGTLPACLTNKWGNAYKHRDQTNDDGVLFNFVEDMGLIDKIVAEGREVLSGFKEGQNFFNKNLKKQMMERYGKSGYISRRRVLLSAMLQFRASTTAGPLTIYIDQNCNKVSKTIAESRVCGKINASSDPRDSISPISVILDPKYDINKHTKIVKFKLNPNKKEDQWVVWKASDKSPLLVYDPEHKGNIKDGSQLFGNFTFGGKSKILNISLNSTANNTWKNGYEALASLDTNNNGKVDGKEIDSLGLWFDTNRNGISEKGEVKKLKDSGITELKYKIDFKDKLGDLYVVNGFKTKIDVGSTVDWYSNIYKDVEDVITNNSLLNKHDDINKEIKKEHSTIKSEDVSGTYSWEVTGDDKARGVLIIEEGENNEVNGFSIKEEKVTSAIEADEISGRFLAYPIVGNKIVENGKVKLNFKVYTGVNTFTESSVEFKEGILKGSSNFTISNAQEPSTISYDWIAERNEYLNR